LARCHNRGPDAYWNTGAIFAAPATAMFEILFIFGVLGLLLGQLWEYLSALPAFPTLLTAFFAVPLLARADYLSLRERFRLEGIAQDRLPVPPERFYWTLQRSQLRNVACLLPLVVVAAWFVALRWPAALACDLTSLAGWSAGLLAILSTVRLVAAATLYVRASQWFDKMAPWAVGLYRTTMYRISENPDFLGPDNPRRQEKEKSVY
jgi:hypothetical protein